MNTQLDSIASTINAVQTTASHNAVPTATREPREVARCLHRSPTGRRCHQVPDRNALYCQRHAGFHPNAPIATDLTPELLGALTEIESPQDTQRLLSKLFVLLVQDRISLKKASVLTYILQQLLRTLNTIDRQNRLDDEDQPPTIIVDIPRPYRGPDLTPDPQPS